MSKKKKWLLIGGSVALISLAVVIYFGCFDVSNGERLRHAAYKGDIATVTRILNRHPELVDSKLHFESKLATLRARWRSSLSRLSGVESIYGFPLAEYNAGYAALHYAAWTGSDEIAQLLLARGANVNFTNNKPGNTPLHVCTFDDVGNRVEMASLLLAHGANPNARGGIGETPLHDCVMENRAEMASLLLAHGANPNARDDRGETPLHKAAYTILRSSSLLDLLFAAGADLNATNDLRETPLSLAKSHRRDNVVEFLQAHGAK